MQVDQVVSSGYSLRSNADSRASESGGNNQFADILAASQASYPTDSSSSNESNGVAMDTNQGQIAIDLESYLNPTPQPSHVNLMDIPLLVPTEHNVSALSKYSEEKFQDLLVQYDIPQAPANIEFDGEGKLVLPDDYPYSEELKQALEDNPGVENALRTTAALASHYVGIMESAAFRDEMMTARNQTDQDRIIQKYSYLFDDNRPGTQIVLSFLEDGSMLVGNKNA